VGALLSTQAVPHGCSSPKTPTELVLMYKTHLTGDCCRFMHRSPEDSSEVPGGFLSDCNPVSISAFGICSAVSGIKSRSLLNYIDSDIFVVELIALMLNKNKQFEKKV